MNSLKMVNLALSFLLELAMVVAFGVWGYHVDGTTLLKWALGLGLPLIIMVFWGIFMAPKASSRLSWPWVPIIAVVLFLLAALALYAAGYKTQGLIMAVLAVINTTLVFVWKQQ
jgi:hypothetical protein